MTDGEVTVRSAPLEQRKPTESWAVLGRLASKPRVLMLPFYRAGVLCPVLGLPVRERYRLPAASRVRTVKMPKGLEHIYCEESVAFGTRTPRERHKHP